MNEYFEKLTNVLLNINSQLSYGQARSWVEGLWEDFEATSAKAGREYRGKEETEKIVLHWINQYGPYLHNYSTDKAKFRYLGDDDHIKH